MTRWALSAGRFALLMVGVGVATIGATRLAYLDAGYVLSGSVLLNGPALVAGVLVIAAWAVLTWRQRARHARRRWRPVWRMVSDRLAAVIAQGAGVLRWR